MGQVVDETISFWAAVIPGPRSIVAFVEVESKIVAEGKIVAFDQVIRAAHAQADTRSPIRPASVAARGVVVGIKDGYGRVAVVQTFVVLDEGVIGVAMQHDAA